MTATTTSSPLPTVILLPEAMAAGGVPRKLTRRQAETAWKLAHAFGHLWGVSVPQKAAVPVLTKEGGSLLPLLPVDEEGYTPPGVDRIYLDVDGAAVHTTGSRSVAWRVSRRGAVDADIRLRPVYPSQEGALIARAIIDPNTGRAEVKIDGLHFENHLGEWRFATPALAPVPAPAHYPRRDNPAAWAAGCLVMVLGAFGLQPPKHITKVVAAYDAAVAAAWGSVND